MTNLKKSLIALSLAVAAKAVPPEIEITRADTAVWRQHPSLKRGKSGVAAAKRAAKKRRGRLK